MAPERCLVANNVPSSFDRDFALAHCTNDFAVKLGSVGRPHFGTEFIVCGAVTALGNNLQNHLMYFHMLTL